MEKKAVEAKRSVILYQLKTNHPWVAKQSADTKGTSFRGEPTLTYADLPGERTRDWANAVLTGGMHRIARQYRSLAKEQSNQTVNSFKANPERNRYYGESVASLFSTIGKLWTFSDVQCLDETRVKLNRDDDYIHASYVDGYLHRKEFICTQGPLVETISDFWSMIWQENCNSIIMLCQLLEKGRQKCAAYWNPLKGKLFTSGEFQIRTVSTQFISLYQHRIAIASLQIRKGDSSSHCREVSHYAHLTWPDKRSPADGYPCTLLIDLVREKKLNPTGPSPIVIHCSAGIGRTGTLVVLDICLRRLQIRGEVDIEGVVRKVRQQRSQVVQTQEQYAFVHKALLEYLKMSGYNLKLDRFLAEFDKQYH